MKQSIGEEPTRERIVRLLIVEQHFSELITEYMEQFSKHKPEEKLLRLLEKIHSYRIYSALFIFVISVCCTNPAHNSSAVQSFN